MQNKVLFFYIFFMFSSQRSGISAAGLAATEEKSYLRTRIETLFPIWPQTTPSESSSAR